MRGRHKFFFSGLLDSCDRTHSALDVRRLDQCGPFLDLALNKFWRYSGDLRSGATKMEPNSFRRLNAVITARPSCSRAASSDCRDDKSIAGAPRCNDAEARYLADHRPSIVQQRGPIGRCAAVRRLRKLDRGEEMFIPEIARIRSEPPQADIVHTSTNISRTSTSGYPRTFTGASRRQGSICRSGSSSPRQRGGPT